MSDQETTTLTRSQCIDEVLALTDRLGAHAAKYHTPGLLSLAAIIRHTVSKRLAPDNSPDDLRELLIKYCTVHQVE